MSSPGPARPLFLQRASYRRRRLMDAARMLPVLGVILLAVPLLWPEPDTLAGAGAQGEVAMSYATIYIFGVWALLILLAGLFSSRAKAWRDADSPHGPGRPTGEDSR